MESHTYSLGFWRLQKIGFSQIRQQYIKQCGCRSLLCYLLATTLGNHRRDVTPRRHKSPSRYVTKAYLAFTRYGHIGVPRLQQLGSDLEQTRGAVDGLDVLELSVSQTSSELPKHPRHLQAHSADAHLQSGPRRMIVQNS